MITNWEGYKITTLPEHVDYFHVSGNGLSIYLLDIPIMSICYAIDKHTTKEDFNNLGIVSELMKWVVWSEQVMVSNNLYMVNGFLRFTKTNDAIGIIDIRKYSTKALQYFFQEFLATGEFPNIDLYAPMLEFTLEPHLAKVKNLQEPIEGKPVWWFLGQTGKDKKGNPTGKSFVCWKRCGGYVVELTRYFETVKLNHIYYGKKVQTFNFRGYDFDGICELARNCHEKYHEAGGRIEFVMELLNMLGTKR